MVRPKRGKKGLPKESREWPPEGRRRGLWSETDQPEYVWSCALCSFFRMSGGLTIKNICLFMDTHLWVQTIVLKYYFTLKKKSLEKWLMFSQGEKCHIEHLVPADTQLPSRQKRSGTNLERITLTKQGAKLSISNFNKTVNMFKSVIFNYKKPNQSLLKEC